MQVLLNIVSRSTSSPSQLHSAVGLDLWASLVEQGLVSLLETISDGMLITRNDPLESSDKKTVRFPELKIRNTAGFVLFRLVSVVETHIALQSRLLSALLHSGNAKLKLNIFSGLLLLAARSPSVVRCLFIIDFFVSILFLWLIVRILMMIHGNYCAEKSIIWTNLQLIMLVMVFYFLILSIYTVVLYISYLCVS
jgi:hypothetical protein